MDQYIYIIINTSAGFYEMSQTSLSWEIQHNSKGTTWYYQNVAELAVKRQEHLPSAYSLKLEKNIEIF